MPSDVDDHSRLAYGELLATRPPGTAGQPY
ncbi:hypothetical protein SSPS47_28120 [Streptomyces sp. S4.7]|nr:hypothetical protein SSPS47_28120 [Streptomyces sp. S4.7]